MKDESKCLSPNEVEMLRTYSKQAKATSNASKKSTPPKRRRGKQRIVHDADEVICYLY